MPRLHCPKCHEVNEIAPGAAKACDFCGFGHPGGVPPDPNADPNEGKMPWDDDYDHAYAAQQADQPLFHEGPAAPAHVSAPATAMPEVLVAAPAPEFVSATMQVAAATLTIDGARLRWHGRGTQADLDIHRIDAVQTAPQTVVWQAILGSALVVLGLAAVGYSALLAGLILTNTAKAGAIVLAVGIITAATARRRMFSIHAGHLTLRTPVGKVGALQGKEAADAIMDVKRRILTAVVHAPEASGNEPDGDWDDEPHDADPAGRLDGGAADSDPAVDDDAPNEVPEQGHNGADNLDLDDLVVPQR